MLIPTISESNLLEHLKAQDNKHLTHYYAFYSSWFGGIIKNPHLMLLPIDDHMVHRGDGVFEAMRVIEGYIYLLDEHLQRLFISAESIHLKTTFSQQEIKNIILETLKVADKTDAMIRVFLSRGPGNFSVNPYDSVESQLYVVVTHSKTPPAEQYEQGVVIGKSNIPVKPSWMAQVKSCNYLPNVLMKKEAVDKQLDYVIGIDADNYITESATENIMIVDKMGVITYPPLHTILKGTTMIRACELATKGGYTVTSKPISVSDLLSAREVMMAGTTLNILPVVKFEDQLIGNGKPGKIAKQLNELMINDIKQKSRSAVF